MAWLVGDPTARPLPETGDAIVPDAPASCHVVALALCAWTFAEANDAEHVDHATVSRAVGRTRAQPAWGFVRYSLLNVWELPDILQMPDLDTHWSDPVTALKISDLVADAVVTPDGRTVRDILDRYLALAVTLLTLPWRFCFQVLCLDRPALFRSMRLGTRLDLAQHVHGQPYISTIESWRRKLPIDSDIGRRRNRKRPPPTDAYADIVLEMPTARRRVEPQPGRQGTGALRNRKEVDPLHLVRALFFARHLNDAREFTEAVDDAHDYEHAGDGSKRDSSVDPSRTSIDRGMQKLDITDLLLHRRELHADAKTDNLVAVSLFSDASPTTGTEVQGMVLDLLRRDGSTDRIVLPGCTLLYGMFDAVSKAVALLHAIWMLAGPDYETVAYVLSKVVSITTDFGCEVKTLEMVDCVYAYCKWMEGFEMMDVRKHVRRDRWWLPNAIRLGDWSHTMGSIMKLTAESWVGWPRKLDQVRCMVVFLRNRSWRAYAKKTLKLDPPEGLDLDALDHFHEQVAKWRYETVAVVFACLSKLFPLLKCVRQEFYANTRDTLMIRGFFDAVGDPELEHFLRTTSTEVFGPVELDRHWGMCCTCPEHVRLRRDEGVKHVPCWWNGRKLPLAADFVDQRIAHYKDRARHVSIDDCQGNNVVFDATKRYLAKAASLFKQRLGYLRRTSTAMGFRTVWHRSWRR